MHARDIHGATGRVGGKLPANVGVTEGGRIAFLHLGPAWPAAGVRRRCGLVVFSGLAAVRSVQDVGEVVARRIRGAVNEWAQANRIDFNVSIGVGHYPEHGSDLESVIAAVDKAMYRSKVELGGGGILHVGCDAATA